MAKIFVSYTIVSPSNFFLVVREKSAPLAEVYRSAVLTPPHVLRNVTVDGINPTVHQVELWTTLDNVTLNQLRGRADIDASQFTQVAFEALPFIAGRGFGAPNYDPAPDPNDEYVNPDIAGLDYLVFKPGFGPLLWDVHIEKRLVSGVDQGGFRFINGQVFGDGEEYTLLISNLTTTQIQGSGNGYPDGIVTLPTDTIFSSLHYRKLLEVTKGNNLTLTITDLDAVPENMVFGINTHNLPNDGLKYAILQLPTGKYCMVNGVQRNTVYVGRAEEVTFIKKGNYLRIVNWDGEYRRVGRREYGDNVPPFNSLPLTGGWYSKTEYGRIFEWYVQNIPGGDLGTGTDDIIPPLRQNKVKWIIGNNKFWVPDHGGYFTRATDPDGNIDPDGNRPVNHVQDSQNKAHNHVTAPYNRSIARASDVDSTNTPAGIDSNNPTSEYRVAGMDADKWTAATIVDEGVAEARPINVAAVGFVII